MANMSNLTIYLTCFVCLFIVTNFKYRVFSAEVSDGVKKSHQADRRLEHGDKENKQGKYKVKSVVQEKTCVGEDCQRTGKSNNSRKRNHRHRHEDKQKVQIHKIGTQIHEHSSRKRHKSRSRSRHVSQKKIRSGLPHDGQVKRTFSHQRKKIKKSTAYNADDVKIHKGQLSGDIIKSPNAKSEVKLSLPQIRGVRLKVGRRNRKHTSRDKTKRKQTRHHKKRTKPAPGEKRKKQEVIMPQVSLKHDNSKANDFKSNRQKYHKQSEYKRKNQNRHQRLPEDKSISSLDKKLMDSKQKQQSDVSLGRSYRRRNPYPWRNAYQRAPPGASRLEQRLHPSLEMSLTNLRNTLERMLYELKEKVARVNYKYENAYSNTRHDVMEAVREELKTITDENDIAYDVILDVSQLVRYVYYRAHTHGLVSPGPKAHTQLAELNVKDFSPDYRKSDNVLHEIRETLREVMSAKRKCMRQEGRANDMIKHLKDRIPKREMDDITHISRRLINRHHSDMSIGLAKYRLQRYKYRYNTLETYVNNAKNLSAMSYRNLKEAQRLFLQNKAFHQRIKSNRDETETRNKRSVPIPRQELRRLSDRAYKHARNLQRVVDIIERSIVPLMGKASELTEGQTNGVLQAQIIRITERVNNLVKKFERKLDELRILLGDEDILRSRCEDLFEAEGFSDTLTPIDCEDFGIYSGSGDLPVSPTPTISSPGVASVATTPTKSLVSSEPKPTKPVEKVEGSGESDFEFVDTGGKKDKEAEGDGGWWPWSDDPNAGSRNLFREKLKEIAAANRSKSEELYQTAEKIESRFQTILSKWNQIQSRMDRNSKYVGLAKIIELSWSDTKPFIEGVKQKIKNAHKTISSQVDKADKILPSALKRTNDILDKIKQSNMSDASNGGPGISVIPELISEVDLIKQNMASLQNVHVDRPAPCKTVETVATKLRTDIAELRKKIDKARDITSAMKMTVAMNGDSFTSVSLKSERLRSPTTTIQVCVQPNGTDMAVVRFYDNETVVYSLDIDNNNPVMTVSDENGKEYGSLTSTLSFDRSHWYNVRINRFGHTLEMRTRRMLDSEDTELVEKIAFPRLSPFQTSPVEAYIGGLPPGKEEDEKKNFTGCIGEVSVNGKNIGLQNNAGKTEICRSQCSSQSPSTMVFEGDGYVKFPLRLISSTYNMDSIHLNFTTRQTDGVIFLLNDRSQTFQVLISITLGSLHIEARTKRGTTVLRSGSDTYANGQRHSVLITFQTDKIEVTTDDGSDQFTAETSTQEIALRLDNGIYLGGLGAKSQPPSGKIKLRPLIGCVSQFLISNKPIPLFMMEESRHVHLGRCSDSIWTQCVWFTSNSKPIVISELDEGDRLYLAVSSDSKGTAIQYKKGKKFNIELSLDAEGINVYDVKEDESQRIKNSLVHLEYWYNIEITDKNSEVTVSFNGQRVVVAYTESTGWLFGNNGDVSKYSLSIGGSSDSDDPLTGGISKLLLNDKPIVLTDYADDHNLEGCKKQSLEPVEAEITEKPIC